MKAWVSDAGTIVAPILPEVDGLETLRILSPSKLFESPQPFLRHFSESQKAFTSAWSEPLLVHNENHVFLQGSQGSGHIWPPGSLLAQRLQSNPCTTSKG